MKPAVLRLQALQDLRNEVRYYRKKAGARVTRRLVDAIELDLKTLQRQPAMGAPTLGHELGIESLRTWEVSVFPLLLIYIEHPLGRTPSDAKPPPLIARAPEPTWSSIRTAGKSEAR